MIGLLTLFTSCSTVKNNIDKNHKKTLNKVNLLLKENGNAFYIKSTYSSMSTVWTYREDKIYIYKLKNSRLLYQQEYTTQNISVLLCNLKCETEEPDNCFMLDGDMFGYRIKQNLEIEKQDFAIDIKCFTTSKYKTKFLTKIIEDINTYKIW